MDNWNKLAQTLRQLIPNHWKNAPQLVAWPDGNVKQQWLSGFTAYRKKRNIPFSNFTGIPLIKVKNQGREFLWKINVNPKPLVSSYLLSNISISKEFGSFLEEVGVYFAEGYDGDELNALVQSSCVGVPDSSTIITTLGSLNKNVVLNCFRRQNGSLNEEICRLIVNFFGTLPRIFRKLPLLQTTGGRFVSAEECMVVARSDLPREWKDGFGNIVLSENINRNLIKKLGLVRLDYEQICTKVFTQHLANEQIISLSSAILNRLPHELNLLKALADKHVKIKSDSGEMRSPSELFENNSQTQSFFLGEKGKFPSESYVVTTLRLVGLKSIQGVTIHDIHERINTISDKSDSPINITTKVKAILSTIKQKGLAGNNFNLVSWIPVAGESPRDYPHNVPWCGKSKGNILFAKPGEVVLPEHQYLIGSVKNILHPDISNSFMKCFKGTAYVNKKIIFADVMAHLRNVEHSFDNNNNKIDTQTMVMHIYDYISQRSPQFFEWWSRYSKLFNVWHGNGFAPPHKVIFIKEDINSLDLSPYFYNLPEAVVIRLGNILRQLPCQKCKLNVYKNTLAEIASKNERRRTNPDLDDSFRDTNLSLFLVEMLAKDFIQEIGNIRSSIFVPVESSTLTLAPLDSCYYLDFADETKFSTSACHSILHRKLDKEVALQLGVPSFTSKVFQGNQAKIFKPWGQKQEPLTKYLKRILENYQDGLAIVKELIQNADDAEATEVSILYDRRSNENHKTSLINPEMKEWQGPSLWVHNNKMFTEQDFMNITKLNAGTKRSEATKIGKFGLGFNAVYHLTDVPSVMSGKNLIIFDPHFRYLGEAVQNCEPGVRISLHENVSDISNFKDQFAVYEGVFGAHINLDSNLKSHLYEGSLFRFPLRNRNCAMTSEINSLHYSEAEMRQLLAKIEDSLDTLLLFTQNVVKFTVYELDSGCMDPNEKRILFSTSRSDTSDPSHSIKNMVDFANKELKNMKVNFYHYNIQSKDVVEKTRITVAKGTTVVSEKEWVIQSRNCSSTAYQFAHDNSVDGFLPYCSIAFNVGSDGKVIPHKGHFFCFLPLPISNSLPGHVNAAFEISSDRLSLKYHNEDEKHFEEMKNWNDIIAQNIGRAYYSMLLYFRENGVSDESFYHLFPDSSSLENQRFNLRATKELLTCCIEKGDDVFPVLGTNANIEWKQWVHLRILGDNVPSNLVESSSKLMNWVYQRKNLEFLCTHLTDDLKNLVRGVGFQDSLQQIEITFEKVVQTLSNNIDDDSLPEDIRNDIIKHLLEEQILHKTDLVKKKCIPTKPFGLLRKPDELVCQDSKVAELYTEKNEVFPSVDRRFMNYLQLHGMKTETLSWEMIVERAKSPPSKKKSELLIKLIDELETPPEMILEDLRQANFIPVLKKSKRTIFDEWKEPKRKFCKPAEAYRNELSTILCCSQFICSIYLNVKTAKLLGINQTPLEKDVIYQLNHVVQIYNSDNKEAVKALKDIITALSKIENLSEQGKNDLQGMDFIRADHNKLVCPSKVFLKTNNIVTDHLHKLHPSYEDDEEVKRFLLNVGVREHPTEVNFTEAIRLLHDSAPDRPLSKKHLEEICNLVRDLSKNEDKSTFSDRMYLPDQSRMLRPLNDLCYNDVDWLPEDPNIHYVNADISKPHAINLGVKSRRLTQLAKSENLDKSNWGDFGQYENLTTRIKHLVDGYSEPFDVFKEMIQNADDAGATEIELILDKRRHNAEKTISEKWKLLQGPALIVVNNGRFTKEDLEGIQKLGVGSRKEDPLKTGKYGVGFNTVYSLTDCPILLTKVDEKDNVLCMFDPNLKYAEAASKERPGMAIHDARNYLEQYDDMKSSLLFDQDYSSRTLLRLVLRNEEVAKESGISDKPVDIPNLETTLKELKTHADEFLLFVNNLKEIKIRFITDDQDTSDSIKIENYDTLDRMLDDFKEAGRKYTMQGMSYEDLCDVTRIHRKHCIKWYSNQKFTESHHWDVFEQIGFSAADAESDEIDEIIEELAQKECHLLPKGGIARISKDTECQKCQSLKTDRNTTGQQTIKKDDKTSIFCTLPLETLTGIKGIINGSFILDSDARRSLFNGKGLRKLWNQSILKKCVLNCFIDHLLYTKIQTKGKYKISIPEIPKEKNHTSIYQNPDSDSVEFLLKQDEIVKYYSNFPTKHKATDEYFKDFSTEFYKHVANNNIDLLCVHKPEDVKFFNHKEFILYQKDAPNKEFPPLLNVMKMANLKVDLICSNIATCFKEASCELQMAKPTHIRNLLMNNPSLIFPKKSEHSKDVKDSCLKTTRNVKILLEYCLEEPEKNGSDGSREEAKVNKGVEVVDDKSKNDSVSGDDEVEDDEVEDDEVEDDKDQDEGVVVIHGNHDFHDGKEVAKDQKQTEKKIKLAGLPLCLLQDNTLTIFKEGQDEVFLTKYTTLFNEEQSRFLHKDLHSVVKKKYIEHQSCLVDFSLESFKEIMLKSSKLKSSKLNETLFFSSSGLSTDTALAKSLSRKKWLSECWSFIASKLKKDKKAQEAKQKIDLEKLKVLNDLPLLLAKANDGSEHLLPIKRRKCILYGSSKNESKIYKFLKECYHSLVPITSFTVESYFGSFVRNIYSDDLLNCLFASDDDFADVVSCLKFAFETNMNIIGKLNLDATGDLLQSLQLLLKDDTKRDCKETLRSLPLFKNFDRKTLTTAEREIIYVLPYKIPKVDSLSIVERVNNIKILHNEEPIMKLYRFLGFNTETRNWGSFYTNFIIPCFEMFDDVQLVVFLQFATENMRYIAWESLKEIRCVITSDKTRKIPNEVYDPTVEIFKLMEPESNFPLKKTKKKKEKRIDYKKSIIITDWNYFFKKIGMISQMNSEIFLRYAKMLENGEKDDIFANASKLLCAELIKNREESKNKTETETNGKSVKCWSEDEEFLEELKNIKFLQPYQFTERFFKSENSTVRKISYNQSVTKDCTPLIWTSRYILPEYALRIENGSSLSNEIAEKLGVVRRSSLDLRSVKQNLETITNAPDYLEDTFSKTCKKIKQEYNQFYTVFLTDSYKFLQNQGNLDDCLKMFNDIPFIITRKNQSLSLDKARQCFSQSNQAFILSPYLNRISSELANFLPLFRILGLKENPSGMQYLSVLSQIKERVGNGNLAEDDKIKAENATIMLSRCLSANESCPPMKIDNANPLYLPTGVNLEKKQEHIKMTLASQCTIADDRIWDRRLKNLKQPVLIFLHSSEENEKACKALLKNLSDTMKPKRLREYVKETLIKSPPINVGSHHISKNLKRTLRSEHFIQGFKRLLKHEESSRGLKQIDEILGNVEVVVMENLKTILEYEGVMIEESSTNSKVFTEIVNKSLTVYLGKESKSLTLLETKISGALLKLLENPFKSPDANIYFSKLFSMPPEEIEHFLDDGQIIKMNNAFQDPIRPPALGQPVPIDHHCLLKQDIEVDFEQGEFVAFDAYDQGEFFIYAKINKVNENGTIQIQLNDDEDIDRYLDDVPKSSLYKFEEQFIKVEGSQVVALDQEGSDDVPAVVNRSLKEIIAEIGAIMKDLKSKDEAEQKRVLRRLYLQWHPDKNPNKELATPVFQFLMQEKEKLNKDFSNLFENWYEQASRNRSSRESYEQNFRRDGCSQNRNSSFFVPPKFKRENPQPREAKKWFKQARHDLENAMNTSHVSHHEWTCYMAHQVTTLIHFQTSRHYFNPFLLKSKHRIRLGHPQNNLFFL